MSMTRIGQTALLGTVLAAGACVGNVSGSGGGGGAPGGGPGGNGAGGNGVGGSGVGGAIMPPTGPLVPGRSPMRRLTRTEYDNTVRALLGDTSNPATQFEAELLAEGFTNNADTQNVGTTLAQQYLGAAEALSVNATKDLPKLLGCNPAAAEGTCLRSFIETFGRRAWRRPLTVTEIDQLGAVYTKGRVDFDIATSTQMVLQVMLLSPHFLYRVEAGAPLTAGATTTALTSWEIASRLSYFLLGSMPDETLFTEAARDGLKTPEQVSAQARRLLTAPGTAAQGRLAQFFSEWFRLARIDKMQKDKTVFPEFTPDLGPLLREETEAFVKNTLFGGPGNLATLLTAPYTYASPTVAKLYGITLPAGSAPVRIDLDPKQRAGLLTQPAVLATFAKPDSTDPVHRGKFVWEGLLCGTVPAPPQDANINPPKITPGTTARQRFTEHRADPTCATCHKVMDPIGLAMENYDALGRWRDKEGQLAIDVSGELIGTDVDGPFVGTVALAQKLAGSEQVMGCLVKQMFRFTFGRYETPEDENTLRRLAFDFRGNKQQVLDLAVAITQTPAFRDLKVGP